MKKKEIKNLKAAIKEKEIQLAKLRLHLDKSAVCANIYNKVVIEKAILNKELQDCEKNKIINKIKNLIPRKKVLICDYFKG